jgi:hypothetical protein
VEAISSKEKLTKSRMNSLIKSKFTRFPVFDGNKNLLIGIIDLQELFANFIKMEEEKTETKLHESGEEFSEEEWIKSLEDLQPNFENAFLIGEDMNIHDLLSQFLQSQIPMAIVTSNPQVRTNLFLILILKGEKKSNSRIRLSQNYNFEEDKELDDEILGIVTFNHLVKRIFEL